VIRAAYVCGEMDSRTNRTLPSAITWLAPPLWKLYVSLSLWQLMTQFPGDERLVLEMAPSSP
jgi:hypothetical protein